jgi:hypothetical protein
VRWRSLAWLGALALLLAQPEPTRARRFDLHLRHRVALQLEPVDAALWFASRYPAYFTSGEAGLQAWLDELAAPEREFVLALGQTLAWAWVEHELARLPATTTHELEPLARAAALLVRGETLNQLELNHDHYPELAAVELDAYDGDPAFAAGVFARLVRGVSNCEGQNHLVALVLEAGLADMGLVARLMHPRVLMIGAVDHELVRVEGPRPLYVDAWSNLVPFTITDEQLDAPLVVAALAPELAGRDPRPPAAYVEPHGRSIAMITPRDAAPKPVDLVMRPPALDPAGLARIRDPLRIYLYARILDVFDDPRAAAVYRWLLDHHCPPRARVFACDAALALTDPRRAATASAWTSSASTSNSPTRAIP